MRENWEIVYPWRDFASGPLALQHFQHHPKVNTIFLSKVCSCISIRSYVIDACKDWGYIDRSTRSYMSNSDIFAFWILTSGGPTAWYVHAFISLTRGEELMDCALRRSHFESETQKRRWIQRVLLLSRFEGHSRDILQHQAIAVLDRLRICVQSYHSS